MSATARETLREMVEREMRVGGCYEGTLAIGYTDCVPVDRAVDVALRLLSEEREKADTALNDLWCRYTDSKDYFAAAQAAAITEARDVLARIAQPGGEEGERG